MRSIGLHLRFTHSFSELIYQIEQLKLSSFQCFLAPHQQSTYMPLAQDIATLNQIRRIENIDLYIHGSYLINLAASDNDFAKKMFRRELHCAKMLESNYLIMHPGAASGFVDRQRGIDTLVRALNESVKCEDGIIILLENIAYGNHSIGGDIQDFVVIREKLDQPERVQFCIDTAHAYAYGYDIGNQEGQDQFINSVVDKLSIDAIKLLHLNDTQEPLGCKRDKHELLTQGLMGTEALQRFALDERLKNIPLIMELPLVGLKEQQEMLNLVKKWHS